MAGMRPFVLCARLGASYSTSLTAAGCPSSQIAIDRLSAVPLWKVIVGPAPTNCKPGPQGSGFFTGFSPARAHARRPGVRVADACASFMHGLRCDLVSLLPTNLRQTRGTDQWPGRPRRLSRSAWGSRSTAISPLSSDQTVLPHVLNGTPHRHRARLGGGWGVSAMELPLPGLPTGVGR